MKLTRTSLTAALLSASMLLSSSPALAATTTTETSLDRCERVTGREKQRCINVNSQTRIRLRTSSANTLIRSNIRAKRRTEENRKVTVTNILDRTQANSTARIRAGIEPVSRRSLRRAIITTPQLKCSRLQGQARALCLQGAYKTQSTQDTTP